MKRHAHQFGPPPWSWAIRRRYFRLVTVEVFWRSDTTAIRALMAVASLAFAVGLLLPFHAFDRPVFAGMAYVASSSTWASLLVLHAIGAFWRIYDPTSRAGVGFAISAFGIGLWSFSTGLIWYAVGEFSPAIGLEVTVIAAAFIALIRTGLNDEVSAP